MSERKKLVTVRELSKIYDMKTSDVSNIINNNGKGTTGKSYNIKGQIQVELNKIAPLIEKWIARRVSKSSTPVKREEKEIAYLNGDYIPITDILSKTGTESRKTGELAKKFSKDAKQIKFGKSKPKWAIPAIDAKKLELHLVTYGPTFKQIEMGHEIPPIKKEHIERKEDGAITAQEFHDEYMEPLEEPSRNLYLKYVAITIKDAKKFADFYGIDFSDALKVIEICNTEFEGENDEN